MLDSSDHMVSGAMTLVCSPSSEGLLEEIGTLATLSLPTFATSDVVPALEPEGTDARMAGGSIHSLPS